MVFIRKLMSCKLWPRLVATVVSICVFIPFLVIPVSAYSNDDTLIFNNVSTVSINRPNNLALTTHNVMTEPIRYVSYATSTDNQTRQYAICTYLATTTLVNNNTLHNYYGFSARLTGFTENHSDYVSILRYRYAIGTMDDLVHMRCVNNWEFSPMFWTNNVWLDESSTGTSADRDRLYFGIYLDYSIRLDYDSYRYASFVGTFSANIELVGYSESGFTKALNNVLDNILKSSQAINVKVGTIENILSNIQSDIQLFEQNVSSDHALINTNINKVYAELIMIYNRVDDILWELMNQGSPAEGSSGLGSSMDDAVAKESEIKNKAISPDDLDNTLSVDTSDFAFDQFFTVFYNWMSAFPMYFVLVTFVLTMGFVALVLSRKGGK